MNLGAARPRLTKEASLTKPRGLLPAVAHNHRRSSCHRSVWHLAGGNVGSPGTTTPTRNSPTIGSSRKGERVSESKRHGIVSCNPAGLLTRGRPRTCGCVGPPHRAVRGDNQTRRSSEPDPSLALGIPSELGQAAHPSATKLRRRTAEGQKSVAFCHSDLVRSGFTNRLEVPGW